MKFLPLLRELVRTYQAFEGFSDGHVRMMGLTPVQFDIVATLGNQPPMTYKTLGDKTLLSKSSLTGVVARMVKNGFLEVFDNPEDGRSQFIKLTNKGEDIFKEVFPLHMKYLRKTFSKLDDEEHRAILESLKKLHSIFNESGI